MSVVDQYLMLMTKKKLAGFMLKSIQLMTRVCFLTTWDIVREVILPVCVAELFLQPLENRTGHRKKILFRSLVNIIVSSFC